MQAAPFSPTPDAAAATYCRRARRLRAQFRDDPARLQAALQELSASADARAGRTSPRHAAERHSREAELIESGPRLIPGEARLFSARVAAALTDGVLRYDDRKDLLREAARAGIGRFEATLLIAAVQHREAARPHGGTSRGRPPRRYALARTPGRFAASIVATALIVQGLIAGAAWWVVHA